MFPGASSVAKASQEQEAGLQARVEELTMLALQIEAVCSKFPKSGKGLFSGEQDRYIVAVPSDNARGMGEGGWGAWLQRWQSGRLAYWVDKVSYKRKEEAKGFLHLLAITKVEVDKEKPKQVTVFHVVDRETRELVLKFPDETKATAWCHALRKLRGLL